MPRVRPRWWKLPSGTPWYGPQPAGGVPWDRPGSPAEAGDQGVDAGDSVPKVDALAFVDDERPEADEVVEGPVEGDVAGDESDGDVEVVGQAAKATRPRKGKASGG